MDSESRVVRGELMFSPAKVVYRSLMIFPLEVFTRTVHFSPWPARVRAGVDVNEVGGSHCEGDSKSDSCAVISRNKVGVPLSMNCLEMVPHDAIVGLAEVLELWRTNARLEVGRHI